MISIQKPDLDLQPDVTKLQAAQVLEKVFIFVEKTVVFTAEQSYKTFFVVTYILAPVVNECVTNSILP
jgi:hypothetical protein